MSFLKTLFKRVEPDIFENLDALKDIKDVIDFCFFDNQGNVIRTGSNLSNSVSQFASIGKHIVHSAILIYVFSNRTKSCADCWSMKCVGGDIIIWNFGRSFLIVLLKKIDNLPIIRMSVNIFKETASDNKSLSGYFKHISECESELSLADSDLQSSINHILGNMEAKQ